MSEKEEEEDDDEEEMPTRNNRTACSSIVSASRSHRYGRQKEGQRKWIVIESMYM